jgi:hypothetical protein
LTGDTRVNGWKTLWSAPTPSSLNCGVQSLKRRPHMTVIQLKRIRVAICERLESLATSCYAVYKAQNERRCPYKCGPQTPHRVRLGATWPVNVPDLRNLIERAWLPKLLSPRRLPRSLPGAAAGRQCAAGADYATAGRKRPSARRRPSRSPKRRARPLKSSTRSSPGCVVSNGAGRGGRGRNIGAAIRLRSRPVRPPSVRRMGHPLRTLGPRCAPARRVDSSYQAAVLRRHGARRPWSASSPMICESTGGKLGVPRGLWKGKLSKDG